MLIDIFDVTVGDVVKKIKSFYDKRITSEELQLFLIAYNIKNFRGEHEWSFKGILHISYYIDHENIGKYKSSISYDSNLKEEDLKRNYYEYMISYLYYYPLKNKIKINS